MLRMNVAGAFLSPGLLDSRVLLLSRPHSTSEPCAVATLSKKGRTDSHRQSTRRLPRSFAVQVEEERVTDPQDSMQFHVWLHHAWLHSAGSGS